ncbi:transposase [Ochrobactrum quorumnocens]|uniref:Transposase n=1 Tax=Ochrobactrum quorumnocens TaxID=271865 RepID=A0A5N1JEH1_9HYPH|nr:transposase [[Ochrobactrum] quorumnocens]
MLFYQPLRLASKLKLRCLTGSSKPSTVSFAPECLNARWFLTLEDARDKLENWRLHYNEDRRHN